MKCKICEKTHEHRHLVESHFEADNLLWAVAEAIIKTPPAPKPEVARPHWWDQQSVNALGVALEQRRAKLSRIRAREAQVAILRRTWIGKAS